MKKTVKQLVQLSAHSHSSEACGVDPLSWIGGIIEKSRLLQCQFIGHLDESDGPNEGLFLNPGEYEVKIVLS